MRLPNQNGENAFKWTRLSCCPFAADTVLFQLHALSYNLANFLRTLWRYRRQSCVGR